MDMMPNEKTGTPVKKKKKKTTRRRITTGSRGSADSVDMTPNEKTGTPVKKKKTTRRRITTGSRGSADSVDMTWTPVKKMMRRRITTGSRGSADSVEYEKTNFSKDAIANLSEKLINTQPSTQHPVFFSLSIDVLNIRSGYYQMVNGAVWVELAATECGCLSFYRIDADMMKSPARPLELWKLSHFGSTLWKSRYIVIAGGNYMASDSNKVFMYDTVDKTWQLLPEMNLKRGDSPIVVSVDDQIFVFGGSRDISDGSRDWGWVKKQNCYKPLRRSRSNTTHSQHNYFVEYYHTDSATGSGRWSWVTTNPPPSLTLEYTPIAVYQNQHLILLWVGGCVVVSFNYKTWEWAQFQDNSPISTFYPNNEKVLVIEDFIFWNSDTTVFAYDLCAHILLPVCDLPITNCLLPDWCTSDSGCESGQLVRLGASTLCLFGKADTFNIWYITFVLQISRGVESTTLHLAVERTGVLETSFLYRKDLVGEVTIAI